jgi:hypothetical protein
MELFHSPEQYLYNLYTTSSSEAKRIWKNQIREKWEHKCAYCDSDKNLTIDHIVPQSRGGLDNVKNVLCCCKHCNYSKGHSNWEHWYKNQIFFCDEKYSKIVNWVKEDIPNNLYRYSKRKNNVANINFNP